MNWISKKKRDIYSTAFQAICEDVKSASSTVISTTGDLLSTGYEKVKEVLFI